jgi:glycosyltransferase involved in cell wall biosynthesis
VPAHRGIDLVKHHTAEAYGNYCTRNNDAINGLLGSVAVVQTGETSLHAYSVEKTSSWPKISVIVPFYNVQEYLDECIESITKQDHNNIEIILVDDASPDRSRTIATHFAARDPRIHIVTHAENRGLGPSRNTGVRNSTGQYIFFLDSDDFLSSPSAISSLASAAQQSKCRVVVGGSVKLMPDRAIQPFDQKDDQNSINKSGGVVAGADAFLASLALPSPYYLPLRAWGMLVDRSLYDELALDFPPGEHEDLGHTPFLYFRSGGVLYTQNIVVTYRVRPGSISNSSWSLGTLHNYRELWRYFKASICRFGLNEHLSDAALAFTRHLIWKLQSNGLHCSSNEVAIELIWDILRDVTGSSYKDYLFGVLDSVREFAGQTIRDREGYSRLTRSVPTFILLDYYRSRLGLGEQQ